MSTDILGPARHVIGSRYVESVKPYLLELTGLYQAVGPNDLATLDIRSDRIVIKVSEYGDIVGLTIT